MSDELLDVLQKRGQSVDLSFKECKEFFSKKETASFELPEENFRENPADFSKEKTEVFSEKKFREEKDVPGNDKVEDKEGDRDSEGRDEPIEEAVLPSIRALKSPEKRDKNVNLEGEPNTLVDPTSANNMPRPIKDPTFSDFCEEPARELSDKPFPNELAKTDSVVAGEIVDQVSMPGEDVREIVGEKDTHNDVLAETVPIHIGEEKIGGQEKAPVKEKKTPLITRSADSSGEPKLLVKQAGQSDTELPQAERVLPKHLSGLSEVKDPVPIILEKDPSGIEVLQDSLPKGPMLIESFQEEDALQGPNVGQRRPVSGEKQPVFQRVDPQSKEVSVNVMQGKVSSETEVLSESQPVVERPILESRENVQDPVEPKKEVFSEKQKDPVLKEFVEKHTEGEKREEGERENLLLENKDDRVQKKFIQRQVGRSIRHSEQRNMEKTADMLTKASNENTERQNALFNQSEREIEWSNLVYRADKIGMRNAQDKVDMVKASTLDTRTANRSESIPSAQSNSFESSNWENAAYQEQANAFYQREKERQRQHRSAQTERVYAQSTVKSGEHNKTAQNTTKAESPASASRVLEVMPAILQHLERMKRSGRAWMKVSLSLPNGKSISLQMRNAANDQLQIRFGREAVEVRESLMSGWSVLTRKAAEKGIRLSRPEFEEGEANTLFMA